MKSDSIDPVVLMSREQKSAIYAAISLTVAVSILLWPLVATEMVVQFPHYILLLLIAVTVIDSMVAGVPTFRQAMPHAAWVIVMTVVAYRVIGYPNSIYLLGMLWFVHSLRSFPLLWMGYDGWWLWSAWGRDCAVAIILFAWSNRYWAGI